MLISKSTPSRVIFVGCLLAAAIFFYFVLHIKVDKRLALLNENALVLSSQEQINSPLSLGADSPMRLKIPSIKVDSKIESVGLTSDGRVGVPSGPSDAAWFNLGPIPGEPGSSVIDGHSGWRNDIPAVFDSLDKLQNGDKIFIEDVAGATTTFSVREIQSYGKDEAVPEVFISSDGLAHLNLITCTGDWNAREKSHSQRLVVFADKVIY